MISECGYDLIWKHFYVLSKTLIPTLMKIKWLGVMVLRTHYLDLFRTSSLEPKGWWNIKIRPLLPSSLWGKFCIDLLPFTSRSVFLFVFYKQFLIPIVSLNSWIIFGITSVRHNVISTLVRRYPNVMDVEKTSKQRCVRTKHNRDITY